MPTTAITLALLCILAVSQLSDRHKITFPVPSHPLSRFDFVDDILQDIVRPDQFLNENDRALNNMLIGVRSSKDCPTAFDDLYTFKGAHRAIGGNLIIIGIIDSETFPELAAKFPNHPQECAWLSFLAIDRPMNEVKYFEGEQLERVSVRAWIGQVTSSTVRVWNRLGFPVDIFWYTESQGEKKIATIPAGTSSTQFSYLGHVFLLRNSETGEFVHHFIVPSTSFDLFLDSEEHAMGLYSTEEQLVQESVDHFVSTRYACNYFQPPLVQNVTEIGFTKMRVPEDLFQAIAEWYRKEEPREAVETSVGPVINQEFTPTLVNYLRGSIRNRIITEIKPILEEWSGHELKMTSLYGIRKYTRGSVLRMHVDTVVTHVVSCIVNVAQDVDEDWMLEIVDHDGNLHQVAMQPGDMVLYESAKALHGRPKPLNGTSYSNFFLHYQPTTPGFWEYSWV